MHSHRRNFCGMLAAVPAAASLAALGLPLAARAAAGRYPEKPISVVVPFAPGGNTDIVARLLGNSLNQRLGTNLVIDNRAGAGGNIGAIAAARSRPDGHNLIYSTATTFCINPHIYTKLGFDPLKDFVPIAVTISVPVVLVVSADSGIKTLKELAQRARANPKSVSYGSNGNGTSSHIACHVLAQKMGAPTALHVPYKQGPQVLTDLQGGQLTYAFDAYSVVGPLVRAGRLVALAVSGKERLEAAPDVPTVAEALGTDYDIVTWNAFCAPAGTPAPMIETLRAAIAQSLAEPAILKRLVADGVPPHPAMTQAQTQAFFAAEFERWGKLVKLVGADATN